MNIGSAIRSAVVYAICLVAFGLSLVPDTAQARQPRSLARQSSVTLEPPSVIFINGVNNTVGEAEVSRAQLALALAEQGVDISRNIVGNFYNPTTGTSIGLPLNDLEEVQIQTALSRAASSGAAARSQYWTRLAISYRNMRSDPTLSGGAARVVDTTYSLVSRIQSELRNKKGAVLVAHSQGNFYVEAAYAILFASGRQDLIDRTRYVGVAVAAATTPSDIYLTAEQDLVIGALRVPFPSALQPNARACLRSRRSSRVCDVFTLGGSGHGFTDVYLNPSIIVYQSSPTRSFRATIGTMASSFLQQLELLNPQEQYYDLIDEFNAANLNTGLWNASGTVSQSGGALALGPGASINTTNPSLISGDRLVLEFRMAAGFASPSGVGVVLVDADDPKSRLYIEETSYFDSGFQLSGTGAFASARLVLGSNVNAFREYRVTFDQDSAKLERGETLSSIDLTGTTSLGASIASRRFLLYLGTNPATSAQFDWVRVRGSQYVINDQFEGAQIDPRVWTPCSAGPSCPNGSLAVKAGELRAANGAYIHTAGKVTLSGYRIVVEAMMGDTETIVFLVDGADAISGFSGNVIMGSNTTYRAWGLNAQTTGRYRIVPPAIEGLITDAEGANVLINSVHNPALLFYRLTVEGDVVTYERGVDAEHITERVKGRMASSVAGRALSLTVGTGVAPYSPGRIQWLRASVSPY